MAYERFSPCRSAFFLSSSISAFSASIAAFFYSIAAAAAAASPVFSSSKARS